jgi:hypothetical protein
MTVPMYPKPTTTIPVARSFINWSISVSPRANSPTVTQPS